MGSICCHMFRFNKAADKPLDKKDDSPATSNLKSVNMTSHMMTYEEEAVMSTSDKKRGSATEEEQGDNTINAKQINIIPSVDPVVTKDPSNGTDDAVITGFGLTEGTVPSVVSVQGGSPSKSMTSDAKEISKDEKDPTLSDDKEQLAVSNQQPSDSSEWEKNHLNVTTFEKDVTTKGIGPVTKYSRSGKPSSRMIMIDKHSDTFYWIETVGGIHQRRKSSGFFRNIQEPFKLSEMNECTIVTNLKDKSGLPMQSSNYASSFLVAFDTRTVYFTAESPEFASKFVNGLNFLRKQQYHAEK